MVKKDAPRTLLVSLLGLLPVAVWAGERKDTDVVCKPTVERLVYDCLITLKGKKSGEPIPDAQFTVGADMPSMPGAHNVRPVAAEPTNETGRYRARLHLEMMGEWALRLDFTKPVRDRVVRKLHFGGKAKRTDQSKHMDHSKHKAEDHRHKH